MSSEYNEKESLDENGNLKNEILEEMVVEFIDKDKIIYERLAKL